MDTANIKNVSRGGAMTPSKVPFVTRVRGAVRYRWRRRVAQPIGRLLIETARMLGYRIERIGAFERRLTHLMRANPSIRFVQVGANDGIRFDGLYFRMTAHRCAGLVIEPIPDIFERLRQNYRDYPEVRPIRVAVHPTLRRAEIYRVDPARIGEVPDWAAGIASFVPGHGEKLGIPSSLIVAEQVDCAPLMEVIELNSMLDASLLQVDTEGFDAEVLKMIDFRKFSPALIKFEWNHMSEDELTTVRALLERAGYRIETDGSDMVASRRG